MLNRKSLIIHFRSPKVLKKLKHRGNLVYFHKKRKYAVLYIDENQSETLFEEISHYRHVRRVEWSLLFEGNGEALEAPTLEEESVK